MDMVFVCPGCGFEKDYDGVYMPAQGRTYACSCGRASLVRPVTLPDGTRELRNGAPPVPSGPRPEQQEIVQIPVGSVQARLQEAAGEGEG